MPSRLALYLTNYFNYDQENFIVNIFLMTCLKTLDGYRTAIDGRADWCLGTAVFEAQTQVDKSSASIIKL